MKKAQSGDTVAVHYTGTLNDGTQFDSSAGRDPLSFQLGSGQVIPGFDEAITGMAINESKTVTIPAEQAYGPHRKDLIQEFDRAGLPKDLEVNVGQQLEASSQEGQRIVVTVVDMNDTTITVDANHALAGQDLTFKLELVNIS